jgi:hypothetical protein
MRAKASLKAGGLTDEFVPITFTVTAVRIKGQVILFDAGSVLDQDHAGGRPRPSADKDHQSSRIFILITSPGWTPTRRSS